MGPEKTKQIQNDGWSVRAGMEVELLGKVTGAPGERKFSMGLEGSSKQGEAAQDEIWNAIDQCFELIGPRGVC